jgi:hypothetical protein
MIRLFLASAGLGLCFKMLLKADDVLTQSLMLLFMPIFIGYGYAAINKISQDKENQDG